MFGIAEEIYDAGSYFESLELLRMGSLSDVLSSAGRFILDEPDLH